MALASNGDQDDEMHAIEAVRSHSISKDAKETKFRVTWVGFRASTLEPLVNLVSCPDLVLHYMRKREQQYPKRFAMVSVSPSKCRSVPIPKAIRAKLKIKDEFVPSGIEEVRNIHASFKLSGVDFFLVTFKGDDLRFMKVRQCLMDYMYPEACLRYYKKPRSRTSARRSECKRS